MSENLVSIITPVYNAEKFISQTIDSVLNQTYSNWEMILVDDCSKDKSQDIIKSYSYDERVKYIKLQENSGAAVSRNTGIKSAKGRFIAFIDSDDLWEATKLEDQIKFMIDNEYGFTFTSYRYMKEDGIKTEKIARVPDKIDYDGLLKNTIIGCSTVVIDREIIGDFDMPLLRKGQDTATWLKILKKEKYAYGIKKSLVNYRQVEGSISSNKLGALKRTWNTYRNVEKLSLPKSTYVFCCYALNALKKRI